MKKKPIYILSGARTPFMAWSRGKKGDGTLGGELKDVDAFDLGASALKGALERGGIGPDSVERVVFSSAYYPGAHACYGARYVSLRSGIPAEVPAPTVSMACASGLYALLTGAHGVLEGLRFVGVGGTDNISRLRKDEFIPSFFDLACGRQIGDTVESLAKERGVTRKEADEWAFESHRATRQIQKAGLLAEEIVPVGPAVEDDHIMLRPVIDSIRDAHPMHRPDGVVTKANTHGLVDGASALILASEEGMNDTSVEPLGRFISASMVGTDPEKMAYASVPAARSALAKAGLEVSDIDLFEINETFGAQMLIDLLELKVPPEKVNVRGGAISLGHPFAGTGCRQILALLLELKRRDLRRGLASICVAGGEGVAVVVERP